MCYPATPVSEFGVNGFAGTVSESLQSSCIVSSKECPSSPKKYASKETKEIGKNGNCFSSGSLHQHEVIEGSEEKIDAENKVQPVENDSIAFCRRN